MIAAVVRPRICASAFRNRRCRSTASAWAFTSSGKTYVRPRIAIEGQSSARARPKFDALDAPGPPHDLDGIPPDGVANAHGADLVAQMADLGRAEDRRERLRADIRRTVDAQDGVLVIRIGVAEIQQEEEPVQLRLGQRKSALELHRVLRRDDEKRIGQRVRRLVDGHLPFLHRLE